MATLKPTLYQIEILRLLTKRYKSTTQIEKELLDLGIQKDFRTLQRDLQTLANHFETQIDVKNDSKPYQYRWNERAVGLNLPTLTPQQSAVLIMAEQQLQSLLPTNILAEMKPFFEQAHHQMKFNEKGSNAKQWLKKIAVAPTNQPLEPPKLNSDIFEQISTALYENRLLKVCYQAQWNEEPKRYTVMPLGLVQQGVRHYLVAQNEKNFGNPFLLALHRFIEAKASTFHFDYPTDFNLNKFVKQEKRFEYGSGKRIQLRFSISWDSGFHLTETPLAPDQTILEQDGEHYRFQVTIRKTQMLERWLRGFGDEIWDIEEVEI